MSELGLPAGYARRLRPRVWDDLAARGDIVWQPDVYPYGRDLAVELEAQRLVDVGCGSAAKLLALEWDDAIGVDTPETIVQLADLHPERRWLAADLDGGLNLDRLVALADGAVVICADVVEHLLHPDRLARLLGRMLRGGAAAVVLSTPARDRARGPDDLGPPANRSHVQEWTLEELTDWLQGFGLQIHTAGYTRSNDRYPDENTCLVQCR